MVQQIQNPRPEGRSKIKNSIWPDVFLCLILALLPALFFWRLLTPNPADRMVIAPGDFTEQYFPLRAFTAQAWVRGQLPLWNPYLFGGQPALADIQSGALYPPHVLESLILGWSGLGFPLWVLELQVIAHFSLAAVGTYLFMRSYLLAWFPLRQARFGGVMAALVFTYGGYLTGFPVQQITILETSAWLPWLMWAVSVAMAARRTVAPYWGALVFAMAILAGHPQTVLYLFYLSLAYSLFYAFSQLNRSSLRLYLAALARSMAPWLIMVILGICLAAAQLLPSLEFIARSLRADLSYQAVSAGLPLNEFIAILYPGFLGGSPAYLGIVSLVLIALALTLTSPHRALPAGQPGFRRYAFFWAGVALVSLLLAFGGHTFLYPLFYLLAPGFEAVRQQERVFLLYSFSAAVLAGCGAVLLTSPLPPASRAIYRQVARRLRGITLIGLVLTAFFIYGSAVSTARGDEVNLFYGVLWHHLFGLIILGGVLLLLYLRSRRWLRRPWGMALLAVWLAFNLFTVNWRFNLAKPADPPPFAPNGVVQFLQANLVPGQPSAQPSRIVSGGLLPGGHSAAAVYNLQDLTGNTPLQVADVATFMQQMPAWRLWQLLSVRYILDSRNIADAGLKLVYEEDALKVFEMADPFPRAWFVAGVEVAGDDQQGLSRLAADNFDLRRTAVVPAPLTLPASDPTRSTVSILALEPTYLKAEVDASGEQLLIFSQIYFPGWQAKIDDQAAELLRVNVIQQGLVVPEGQHIVELEFSPASFWLGAALSLAALVVCLVLLIWHHFQPRDSIEESRSSSSFIPG